MVADEPDGRNINEGCGSTHVDRLAERVREGGYDAGFAFDGDGDRVLAVDRNGVVVDGDELIALAALHLAAAACRRRRGGDGDDQLRLPHRDARGRGRGRHTAVGDRYVLEELRERGWSLGGEQSGHIIDMGFAPSGDGIASALLTLEALGDGDLADRDAMEKLPQTLVNVRVRDRGALAERLGRARGGRPRGGGARGARARAPAAQRHRAARARDGRGAERRRGRGRMRQVGRDGEGEVA